MNQNYNVVENILVPHSAFERATKRILQCIRAVESSSEPICLAIIGESRTGKTRILEYVESQYPRFRTEEGMNIPILRMTIPAKPTIKGLAEEILMALGDPKPSKGTVRNMTGRIITLLGETKTLCIIVDEFQHFFNKEQRKVMHDVADWFKVLVDKCGVVLVTSGLDSSQSVLNLNEQLAGRFMAPICIPRYDWKDETSRNEFISILDAFRVGLTDFDMPDLSTDEMAFRFHCASGGLLGYVAKVLRQATWIAIDNKTTQITLQDLALAYEESIYSDLKKLNLRNPFGHGFTLQASEELLVRVRQIGTEIPEDPKPKAPRQKKKQPSVGEAMHA